MLWQLYPSYLLITIIAVVAIAWYASSKLRDFYVANIAESLESRARLVEVQVEQFVESGQYDIVDSLCDRLGKSSSTRVTVIIPSGRVIGDSEKDPSIMENHSDRLEIAEALSGQVGLSTRYSTTLTATLMYVAIPIEIDELIAGVVRTSIPITSVELALDEIRMKIAFAGVAVAIIAALVSLYVARRISRPLERLKNAADRFAEGHLRRRIAVKGSNEIASLADAMNRMAAELDRRMNTITKQSRDKEAILSSMLEGVLAVDADERIIEINDAAVTLLDLRDIEVRGRSIHEMIRNAELQRLVTDTLASEEDQTVETTLRNNGHLHVLGHGTVLTDEDGSRIGALIVLNDITRLKKLEIVRKDFVANVSHELRTPITSVKGYVETLLDGDLRDSDETKRFLEIIAKQADRLDSLVEDLLNLSRLEEQADQTSMSMKTTRIREILASSVQACESIAASKSIEIQLECDENLSATLNRTLMEQAVINLIDNAIKYSSQGDSVRVSAEESGDMMTISVADTGVGIEEKHLDRIFERFYCIDRARSRELGGTGLGLSIVKHTALIHNGSVSVDSEPGKGSAFSIQIPLRQADA
jgi:two-component system phosphate regulon sensor histidine kinase PhoR